MRSVLTSVLATSLLALGSISALPYPFGGDRDYTSIAVRGADVIGQLGPQLSSNATIYTPGEPQFANATARYSAYSEPNFTFVVEPGVEADIPIIVSYANSVNLPFIAVNRGHGATETLGRLKYGIEIHIRVLNKVVIAADGKSAFMQGGAYGNEVITTLWDAGYVTTTGSCTCVGILGPGLGGGFGRYMGFYGLVSDNLIDMNVVLGNGTAITVSAAATPDLWWAMRGAGHNFGIVTSFHKEIYPKTVDTWYYADIIYTQDKLEQLFVAVNKLSNNGTQPKELLFGLTYVWDPAISTTDPLIAMVFYYVGSATQAATYTAPLQAVGPISFTDGNVPYPDVADATGTGVTSPLCQFGMSRIEYPLGILVYNITTQRKVFEYFKNATLAQPKFNGSAVVMENYSLEGMKAIDPASSAYPHRSDNIVVNINVNYLPDPSLDAAAIQIARNVKAIFQSGQPGRPETAYVNYAFGDEPLEQIYGYAPWRLEKLRAVKAKYDPLNKFCYYNPIIPP